MEYKPSALFRHHHFSTIFPSLFRKVKGVSYQRERIETPDDDFIDLDWSSYNNERLVVICHGLEGSGDSAYVRGMAKIFNNKDWDAVAYNYRACSGEMNRHLKAYHAGATYDLHTVLEHIISTKKYNEIALVGFSLGGNLILKYLGEAPGKVSNVVKKAVAISAPVDLESCAKSISSPSNFIYNDRFIRKLRKKSAAKKQQIIAAGMDYEALMKTKSLKEFDDKFTAPANGFDDAIDYWTKNSSRQFLKNIQKPTLLLNALNDPFLAPPCFPYEEAKANPNFKLMTPKYGGHVGFAQFNKDGYYWDEGVAVDFCNG
jgi:predicted alpha/beta-fold hydrolase